VSFQIKSAILNEERGFLDGKTTLRRVFTQKKEDFALETNIIARK
jgi:hypothetical protein